jgi:hypothetical protein
MTRILRNLDRFPTFFSGLAFLLTLFPPVLTPCESGCLPSSLYSEYLPLLANLDPPLVRYAEYLDLLWRQIAGGYSYLTKRSEVLRLVSAVNEAAADRLKWMQEHNGHDENEDVDKWV